MSARAPILRGLSLGLQIGLSVSLPLLILGLGGRWLDRRVDTSPLFFLIGILLASIFGLVLVTRAVRQVTGTAGQDSSLRSE